MPVYMNPKIGDCSSGNSLDCAESYERASLLSDEEEDFRREIPPEETEDYIEAKARYDAHIKLMGDSLTIFDELYWRRWLYDMKNTANTWGGFLNGKLIVLGTELAACLLLGGIFMGVFCIVLALAGPIRIKTLGLLIVACIVGSIFATGSIEMAASVLIGVTLILFIFLAKISTGNRVLKVKNRRLKSKAFNANGEDLVYVFIDFWYMGDRSIWIDLSNKLVGIL